jgi:hypothetical protein
MMRTGLVGYCWAWAVAHPIAQTNPASTTMIERFMGVSPILVEASSAV